jgi:hypothetical protein
MRLKEAIERAKATNRVMSHRNSQAEYYRENREVIQEKRRSSRGSGYGG